MLKGKDKHMWFKLQWYENCSKMLVETKPDGQSDTVCKWIDYCNKCQSQCPIFHSNSVMTAVQGAVFSYLSKVVSKEMPETTGTTDEGVSAVMSTTILEVLPYLECCINVTVTFTHAHSTREALLWSK